VSSEPSPWKPLTRPEFRGVWASTLAIHLANWMQQVGAASLMTTLTPSPTMTALVQTAASLPAVLLGLPAGALADLIERRRWLIFVQLWLLTAIVITGASIAFGAAGPWGLLALTALIGVGFALHMPASQALLGEIVPRAELPAALVLAGVSFNISRIAGPAFAGLLISLGGGVAVYAAVGVCSIGTLLFLLQWKGVERKSIAPPERLWSALRSGVRYVRHAPECRVQLMHTLVFMLCGSATWALLPVLARDGYGLGAGGYGLLLGAFGIGGVLGVFVMPVMKRRWPPHGVVAWSALGFGLITVSLAFPLPLPLALCELVVGGTVWMCGASSIYAALQGSLPDWVRARGISIYNLTYFASMAGGAALWGACAGITGTSVTLGLAGCSMALSALWLRRQPIDKPRPDDLPPTTGFEGMLPTLQTELAPDDEALLVQYLYRVRPDCVDAFVHAQADVGASCRRNGAEFWRLYRDLHEAGLYIERYIVESWSELQRQHERMSAEDMRLRARLLDFLQPGTAPVVRHHAVQAMPAEKQPHA
jgi:MFS family permease